MQTIQDAINEVYGGDPIKGRGALMRLIEAGDEGEDLFLSGTLKEAPTVQVYRRLLQYVASREQTIVPKLVRRLDKASYSSENHVIASLFAGAADTDFCIGALMDQFTYPLSRYTENAGSLVKAWGYAGGGAWACIDSVEDSLLWEKCCMHALRGISATVARMHQDDLVHLAQIVTNERKYGRWEAIPRRREEDTKRTRIGLSDCWYEGYFTFPLWRRGAVCDVVLRDWLHHDHYRVRQFAVHMLGGLGFQRIVSPVIARIYLEEDEDIKGSLSGLLGRCETVEAADFLLGILHEDSRAASGFVKVAHLCSGREEAIAALNKLLVPSVTGELAEGLLALGKLGMRPNSITHYLDSRDYYTRLCAALCLGYLDETSYVPRLKTMMEESGRVFDRVFIAVALCMLRKGTAAHLLQGELVKAACDPDYDKRIDFIYLHKHLQRAILDAFEACGDEGKAYGEAWAVEFGGLEPIPGRVDYATAVTAIAAIAVTAVTAAAAVTATTATTASTAGGTAAGEMPAGVEIFFSYAWGEEREVIVDKLYETLRLEKGYVVVRDKQDLGYKGLILDFMQRIGRGHFVITAFSDKYLRSEFCMFELYELYRNSRSDVRLLLEKIYPIRVEALDLNNPLVIGKYLAYWTQLERDWAELIAKNTQLIGTAHFQRYERIKRISQHVSELLELIANVNALNVQLLAADNFQVIKEEIERNVMRGAS